MYVWREVEAEALPPIDDSTSESALDHKTSHKASPPPLHKMVVPRFHSVEVAVANIFYDLLPPSLQLYNK
ncbi:hypothetical protein V8E53_004198 [Lactarius tabidus]